jgi:hypothetical protein
MSFGVKPQSGILFGQPISQQRKHGDLIRRQAGPSRGRMATAVYYCTGPDG